MLVALVNVKGAFTHGADSVEGLVMLHVGGCDSAH